MEKERTPKHESFCIEGLRKDAEKLYNELVQWNRCGRDNKSPQASVLFGMGMAVSDLAYHGIVGEFREAECGKFNALYGAYKCLLATVEDLIGVKGEDFDSELNEKGECRYQIVDTKAEH